MASIGSIAKAVGGAVVGGLTAAVAALSDGTITSTEWLVIIGTFIVGGYAVWQVPNLPRGVLKYGKAATGAVLAGLGSVTAVWQGGGSLTHPAAWVAVAVAILASLGIVASVPNAVRSDALWEQPPGDLMGDVPDPVAVDPVVPVAAVEPAEPDPGDALEEDTPLPPPTAAY